jgi:hypothetical protein
MSKMRRNRDVPHIGRGGADIAADRGPSPLQAIATHSKVLAEAGLTSVNDYISVGYFRHTGQKLLVGRDLPLYPGTDVFQRLKLVTGGPAGKTDPQDIP